MTDERRPEGARRRTTRTRTIPARRDIIARLGYLAEALSAGDYGLATAIVLDLLDELEPVRPSSRCPECGLAMWPGQLPAHRSNVHGVDPYAVAA